MLTRAAPDREISWPATSRRSSSRPGLFRRPGPRVTSPDGALPRAGVLAALILFLVELSSWMARQPVLDVVVARALDNAMPYVYWKAAPGAERISHERPAPPPPPVYARAGASRSRRGSARTPRPRLPRRCPPRAACYARCLATSPAAIAACTASRSTQASSPPPSSPQPPSTTPTPQLSTSASRRSATPVTREPRSTEWSGVVPALGAPRAASRPASAPQHPPPPPPPPPHALPGRSEGCVGRAWMTCVGGHRHVLRTALSLGGAASWTRLRRRVVW